MAGYKEQLALYRESLPHHVQVLFDRYRLVDLAIKVVGIGSVGTACGLGLFIAADEDPLSSRSRKLAPRCSSPTPARASSPTTVNAWSRASA
jgi:hypothetical protein